jgi:hypothetical protein
LYKWSHSPVWHVMEFNNNRFIFFALIMSMLPIAI